jgi:hypothetical protein
MLSMPSDYLNITAGFQVQEHEHKVVNHFEFLCAPSAFSASLR